VAARVRYRSRASGSGSGSGSGDRAEEYAHTAAFHGASFRESDLHGATFRDCDLRHVKITISAVDDMRISGFDGRAKTVVVDDDGSGAAAWVALAARSPGAVDVRASMPGTSASSRVRTGTGP